MSAPMETSSDSSMDEDEAKRLKEASIDGVDNELNNDYKPNKSNNSQISDKQEKRNGGSTRKPSLRHVMETRTENFEGNIKTTPQVREFIAKKLSTALDQSIELLKDIKEKTSNEAQEKDNEGFHMFSRSTQKQLDKLSEARRLRIKEAQKKRQQKKEISSDSSDEEARIAEAAVSAEFIVNQSRANSSTVTKATDEDSKHGGNSDSDTTHSRLNSMCQDDPDNTTVKHKKKKKRKSKNGENPTIVNSETISDGCSAKKKKKRELKDLELNTSS